MPAASTSHVQAADGFKAATDGVEDLEALRVLKLLEDQHRQLARIVSSASDQANPPSTIPETVEEIPPVVKAPVSAGSTSVQKQSASPTFARRPPRELSSSIANNLATARGIPPKRRADPSLSGTPGHQEINKDRQGDLSSPQPHTKLDVSKGSGQAVKPAPPSVESTNKSEEEPGSSDEPFEKFYATWGGLLSKISAPLAFAGLPLTNEDTSAAPSKKQTRSTAQLSTRDPMASIPDVSKIFSKAALRAVKQDHPGFGGIHDSYLVVPPTGGTTSYANIHRIKEDRDEDLKHEQFVDASEAPQPGTPKATRRTRASEGKTGKTVEELEMENESLKKLTDNLSRRLYMWEKSAQNQSMALQQSIRHIQPPSNPSSDGGQETNSDDRISSLEEQLNTAKKEIDSGRRENEKLNRVITQYRERWEKLKEGARRRKEGEKVPDVG